MSAIAEQPLTARPPALQGVPPFPPVAAQLMRLVSDEDEDFSYKDVADLIRTDAAFSAQVLRLANSSVFGFRYEIKDIPHAVAVLGLNRLRAITTTLAMKDIMRGMRHEAVQRSWRHNLATALACELLAGASWVDSGLGYTAGLIHDVGLLAMIALHADEYAGLINSLTSNPDEFMEKESALVGLNHCEAGHWLLTDWELPEEFRHAAANHHRDRNGNTPDITALVHLGCMTASMAGFPVCMVSSVWEPELICAYLPEKVRERYHAKLEDFPMTVATKINSFDCDFLT